MNVLGHEGTRVLGIDYGSKRIGLALSDPVGVIAQAFETIPNDENVLDRLNAIIATEGVRLVVVGMPLNLKGERGHKSLEVDDFIVRLRDAIAIDVVEWDERFTSTLAQRSMRDLGTKKKKRAEKGRIDAMAAALMLQSFLDRTKRSIGC